MLSVILLVVLAGGAGLWAVALAEGRETVGGRRDSSGRSLRADEDPATATPEPDEDAEDADPPSEWARALDAYDDAPEPEPAPVTAPAPSPAPAPRPVAPARPSRHGPVAVASASGLPASQVAVEGEWRELRVPFLRRLLSFAAIAAIVAVVGIVIAVVLGASIGAMAELLDGAVG